MKNIILVTQLLLCLIIAAEQEPESSSNDEVQAFSNVVKVHFFICGTIKSPYISKVHVTHSKTSNGFNYVGLEKSVFWEKSKHKTFVINDNSTDTRRSVGLVFNNNFSHEEVPSGEYYVFGKLRKQNEIIVDFLIDCQSLNEICTVLAYDYIKKYESMENFVRIVNNIDRTKKESLKNHIINDFDKVIEKACLDKYMLENQSSFKDSPVREEALRSISKICWPHLSKYLSYYPQDFILNKYIKKILMNSTFENIITIKGGSGIADVGNVLTKKVQKHRRAIMKLNVLIRIYQSCVKEGAENYFVDKYFRDSQENFLWFKNHLIEIEEENEKLSKIDFKQPPAIEDHVRVLPNFKFEWSKPLTQDEKLERVQRQLFLKSKGL